MLMQKRQWKLVRWMILVLLAAVIAVQWQQPVQAQDAAEGGKRSVTRTIAVNGEGEVKIEPDIAYINLAVVTEGKTAEEAQTDNAKIFGKVRDVLFTKFEIAEKDVQTSSFRVRPNYTYQEGKEPEIASYTATQSVRVTYRELERIGEVLDAVAKAGVNRVDNVQFTVEKAEQYELQALQEAMKNARQKAEVLAAVENETVKGVVSISQNGASSGVYYGENIRVAYDSSVTADGVVSTVNPGEIVVSAHVNVVYEF